eukprot:g76021.t1
MRGRVPTGRRPARAPPAAPSPDASFCVWLPLLVALLVLAVVCPASPPPAAGKEDTAAVLAWGNEPSVVQLGAGRGWVAAAAALRPPRPTAGFALYVQTPELYGASDYEADVLRVAWVLLDAAGLPLPPAGGSVRLAWASHPPAGGELEDGGWSAGPAAGFVRARVPPAAFGASAAERAVVASLQVPGAPPDSRPPSQEFRVRLVPPPCPPACCLPGPAADGSGPYVLAEAQWFPLAPDSEWRAHLVLAREPPHADCAECLGVEWAACFGPGAAPRAAGEQLTLSFVALAAAAPRTASYASLGTVRWRAGAGALALHCLVMSLVSRGATGPRLFGANTAVAINGKQSLRVDLRPPFLVGAYAATESLPALRGLPCAGCRAARLCLVPVYRHSCAADHEPGRVAARRCEAAPGLLAAVNDSGCCNVTSRCAGWPAPACVSAAAGGTAPDHNVTWPAWSFVPGSLALESRHPLIPPRPGWWRRQSWTRGADDVTPLVMLSATGVLGAGWAVYSCCQYRDLSAEASLAGPGNKSLLVSRSDAGGWELVLPVGALPLPWGPHLLASWRGQTAPGWLLTVEAAYPVTEDPRLGVHADESVQLHTTGRACAGALARPGAAWHCLPPARAALAVYDLVALELRAEYYAPFAPAGQPLATCEHGGTLLPLHCSQLYSAGCLVARWCLSAGAPAVDADLSAYVCLDGPGAGGAVRLEARTRPDCALCCGPLRTARSRGASASHPARRGGWSRATCRCRHSAGPQWELTFDTRQAAALNRAGGGSTPRHRLRLGALRLWLVAAAHVVPVLLRSGAADSLRAGRLHAGGSRPGHGCAAPPPELVPSHPSVCDSAVPRQCKPGAQRISTVGEVLCEVQRSVVWPGRQELWLPVTCNAGTGRLTSCHVALCLNDRAWDVEMLLAAVGEVGVACDALPAFCPENTHVLDVHFVLSIELRALDASCSAVQDFTAAAGLPPLGKSESYIVAGNTTVAAGYAAALSLLRRLRRDALAYTVAAPVAPFATACDGRRLARVTERHEPHRGRCLALCCHSHSWLLTRRLYWAT